MLASDYQENVSSDAQVSLTNMMLKMNSSFQENKYNILSVMFQYVLFLLIVAVHGIVVNRPLHDFTAIELSSRQGSEHTIYFNSEYNQTTYLRLYITTQFPKYIISVPDCVISVTTDSGQLHNYTGDYNVDTFITVGRYERVQFNITVLKGCGYVSGRMVVRTRLYHHQDQSYPLVSPYSTDPNQIPTLYMYDYSVAITKDSPPAYVKVVLDDNQTGFLQAIHLTGETSDLSICDLYGSGNYLPTSDKYENKSTMWVLPLNSGVNYIGIYLNTNDYVYLKVMNSGYLDSVSNQEFTHVNVLLYICCLFVTYWANFRTLFLTKIN